MRICYFADGESIHIVRWCSYFASLGHEVHLISFKNVVIENVHTHFIPSGNIAVEGGNWKVLLKFNKVRSLLKKIKPDIFHSHYATSYGITGALCGFHPYVITAHGSDILISGSRSKIYKVLLKFAFGRADWIHLVAAHMLDAAKEIGADMSKVSVVYLGIDAAVFNKENRKLPENKFVITSTRNLEPVYNIPHLINSIAQIKDKIPGLEFNIIGDGSLRKELEDMIKAKGLSSQTRFFGKVPQSKIAEVLGSSHLYVSVAISDGNSLSLAEAMACGVLCIATNIPANNQWIKNGENGFLVNTDDVNDLANKILNSYHNYDAMQKVASVENEKLIEEFAIWKNNMKKIEQKYESLIGFK